MSVATIGAVTSVCMSTAGPSLNVYIYKLLTVKIDSAQDTKQRMNRLVHGGPETFQSEAHRDWQKAHLQTSRQHCPEV